jgi:hypothetical protein
MAQNPHPPVEGPLKGNYLYGSAYVAPISAPRTQEPPLDLSKLPPDASTLYPQTPAIERSPTIPLFLGARERIAQKRLNRIESKLGELAHSYAVNRTIGENLLTRNDYTRLSLTTPDVEKPRAGDGEEPSPEAKKERVELRPKSKKDLVTARRLGEILTERGDVVGLLHSMESHPGNTIALSGGEYPSVATTSSTTAEDEKRLKRAHGIHNRSSKKAVHLDHEFVEIINEPLRRSEKLREKQGKIRSNLHNIQTRREEIKRNKQQHRADHRAAQELRRGIRKTRP